MISNSPVSVRESGPSETTPSGATGFFVMTNDNRDALLLLLLLLSVVEVARSESQVKPREQNKGVSKMKSMSGRLNMMIRQV